MGWDRAHLVRRPLFGLLYQSRMINECEAVCGMRIGRGNRSNRRKLSTSALCPPQIAHDQNWDRSRRLTSWPMTRPSRVHKSASDLLLCPATHTDTIRTFVQRCSRRPGMSTERQWSPEPTNSNVRSAPVTDVRWFNLRECWDKRNGTVRTEE
jgi:hypothetical protein